MSCRVSSVTSRPLGFEVIVEMYPGVGGKLASRVHGQGFMFGPSVLTRGVGIEDAGPQQSPAPSGDNGEVVREGGEGRTPPSLNVRKVQKEGKDPWTTGSIGLVGDVIVMLFVKLSHVVIEELQVLVVIGRNARHGRDAFQHGRHDGVRSTVGFGRTPRVVTGPTGTFGTVVGTVEFTGPDVPRPFVALLVTERNQMRTFFRG